MSHSVFDHTNKIDSTKAKTFLDPSGGVVIARYDKQKHPMFDNLTEKQLGFFWRPQEVDISRDGKDFKDLSEHEKHIFTSNLKRQILLDSVQGRAPNDAFLPLVSIPELEVWIQTWAFSETIHSRSYTHIIRNVYSNPSTVFDDILNIQEIIDCAEDISKYYDDLIEYTGWYNLLGEGTHTVNGKQIVVDLYELKKKIWLCINSVNALEGIRFYVSFACSWAFAELKRMEGNAKIIKLICRDENLHLASTQYLLKVLPKEDPQFQKIKEETQAECEQMFMDVVEQEKQWAEYLFQDGSMIGLNRELLCEYVDWIACRRAATVGLNIPIKVRNNPLPWTEKWISGADVQVAPQETEITSYVIGGVKKDVTKDTFSGFTL